MDADPLDQRFHDHFKQRLGGCPYAHPGDGADEALGSSRRLCCAG
jgi:hypothetical protein